MFAVSSSLMFAHLGAYVLIPILMGIVATWLISGNRLRGWLFYLVSWFVGVGVVGYGFFLLQFVRYGIDRVAYLLLFVLLVVLLIIKLIATKTTFRDLIKTLAISLRISYWKDASRKQRVISIVL